MWFSHPDFLRMVEDSWKSPVYGNLDFIFPYKLRRLKEAIKLWNQTVFGNVNARLKQAQLKFEVACRNSDEDPFNTSKLNIMKDSLVAVQDVRMQHLTMLKQKARNRWILEGSSNTSFFHSNINIRRSTNTISELVTEDGVTISEPIQLRDHVVSYYESKFNGVELPIEDNLFDYEHESISMTDKQMLDAIPSLDEIKSAVFDLGADSAPGPDGFSGCFYRHCWDIIQQDLHSAIVYAWTSKSIPKGSNSSLIILIAKVRGADSLRKYRPIGLSNFFFKIFTKILATRLGRVLDKLVSEEQVAFMKEDMVFLRIGVCGFRKFWSHRAYLFCSMVARKGNMKSLRSLVKLLDSYQQASGQRVCREKSKIYFGGGSLSRRQTIAAFLGMEVTHFPDRYLGVKVMPGAVRYHHISNVVDKLKEQLSVLKVAGEIHSANPVEEGGLGITSLKTMNKALLMKLWWSIKYSSKRWARFLESKFTCRDGRLKMAGVKSSILPGIRWVHKEVVNNTKCIIGDGRNTSLFYDVWYGSETLASVLNRSDLDRSGRVCDIISHGNWLLQGAHLQDLVSAGVVMENLPTLCSGRDKRIWMPDMKGVFSVKSARDLIRKKFPTMKEASLLWRKVVHPSLAAQNWKFVRGACATLDKVRSRFKIQLASRCSVCHIEEETLQHVLWSCSFAQKAWNWIAGIFNIKPHYDLITSYNGARLQSGIVRDLWLVANLVVRSELWFTRNKKVYEKKVPCWSFFQKRVFNLMHEYSARMKSFMYNTVAELRILDFFRVKHRKVKISDPKECYWTPPNNNELMLCTDGASRGNPGVAGAGVVARNASLEVVGAMCIGLGIATNYMAELYGIIVCLEWAIQWGYDRLLIRSDSSSVLKALEEDNVPWFATQRWLNAKGLYGAIRFVHTFREANFAADGMAKRGCLLEEGVDLHSKRTTPNNVLQRFLISIA
ncbi:uncharacterized protein LOC113343173 [Papaver somniferum]|uniref:uncharacterized protein LOC113343173 n=1 Tax=Papaver somniferum TaxID=3469 RepID=UPI000E6F8F64|nr:uncharacterized protein LOC113343173 [Papaver somniferum]